MRIITLSALVSSFIFTGCVHYPYSESPVATNFKTVEQKKLQSAQHWKVISDHISENLVSNINITKQSFFIKLKNKPSDFEIALNQLITSSLVNKGASVSVKEQYNDVKTEVEIQKIKYSREGFEYPNMFGSPVLITSGVWAIAANSSNLAAALGGTAGLTTGYSWFDSKYSSGKAPKHEIIVSVIATKNNKYLSNKSYIFYIADNDSALYTNDNRTFMISKD